MDAKQIETPHVAGAKSDSSGAGLSDTPPDLWPVDKVRLGLCLEKLESFLNSLDSGEGLALAYSGGLDSRVLVQVCLNMGIKIEAMHFYGPQFARDHTSAAMAWLEKKGVPCQVVDCYTLSVPEVRHSDPKRCYYCKKNSLGHLKRLAGARPLCDGTNFSDLSEYRPGLAALRELGVFSPFAALLLTKPMILCLAEMLDMEIPPANYQNCLVTRFEYGLTIDERQLALIEAGEAALRPLLASCATPGARCPALQYRLRCLADPATVYGCRMELHIKSPTLLPEKLYDALRETLAQHGLQNTNILTMPEIGGFFDSRLS